MKRTWDIFCAVVDNYGDIGVCWRLSRQLAREFGQHVRLWVDDLAAFQHLCHTVDPAQGAQYIETVEVRRWDSAALCAVEPAQIIVDGFGARLPDHYIHAMSLQRQRPVWINLEYLSAETWVEGCHGLPSPHPSLRLTKYFFFPGFTAATGGLLVERDLIDARNAFQNDPEARAGFWRALSVPHATSMLHVSLFSYANAALRPLIAAWAAGAQSVVCVVPDGPVLAEISAMLGTSLRVGVPRQHGRLTFAPVPFLELDDYDRLLWACDLNFVRGEDSFVRAQLAARSMIWQVYPQEERAHWQKLHAFVARYGEGMDAQTRGLHDALHEAWNAGAADIADLWPAWAQHRQALARHAGDWAGRLADGGNLAGKLAEFCEDRLK